MPGKNKKKTTNKKDDQEKEEETNHANLIIYAFPFFYSKTEAINNSLSI